METETIREFEIEFGTRNFLSVAHKLAELEIEDPVEYLAITRGYTDVRGAKRYKSRVQVPYLPHLISWLLIGLDLTRHDGEVAVPEDTEALVVSHDTARVALRELDILIDRTEGEEPDPLQSDIFDARDELQSRLRPDEKEEDESDSIEDLFEEAEAA